MALRKRKEVENEVETAPVETAPVETAPVETAPVETAPVETAPAPMQRVETTPVETDPAPMQQVEDAPVATPPAPMQPVQNVKSLDDLRNVCVRDFGTFDRLKAESGEITDQDDESYGGWIEVEVASFNSRYTVSPNDDDAPSDACGYSLDGLVLDGDPSVTVASYLADMKKDWPKASCKEYFEVVGLLLDADDKKSTELIDSLIQVQLSPTSRKSFENYKDQILFKVARGKASAEDVPFVRFTAKKKKGGGKSWTMLRSSKAVAREAVE